MDRIIYTLIIAGLGGYTGIKLKLPAGALIGSMFSVAFYNMSTGNGYIPIYFKLIAQIIVGGVIGLSFDKATVKSLKALALPAVILAMGLLAYNLLLGYIISGLTGLDLTTALFSCAPGGVTDMTLISEAYGADTPKVALLHLVRLISVISLFPLLIARFAKKND
ncbi:MAG TPA: AbrB family transcriptional regulator [Clostridia bacterium]|nr:AbrB family transcriptional regulator [Clostridia bacterium]